MLLAHAHGVGVLPPPAAAARSVTKHSYTYTRRKRLATVRGVMARPQEVVVAPAPPAARPAAPPPPARERTAPAPPPPAATTTTTYRDNWFDKLAIGYLSRNLQEASGTYFARLHIHSFVLATFGMIESFFLP